MPKKTAQELREWYQKFSKELYEKVQIDVARKEDLGCVRVFKSDQWSVDNLAPDMQITYAYMPHDGTNYADPEPELGDFRKYAQWMSKNLNPDVTDEQIRKLYEQSRTGELMVFQPGGYLGNIQMVLTDANGNITLSVPGNEYDNDKAQIPEDQLPTPPQVRQGAGPHRVRPSRAAAAAQEPEARLAFLAWLPIVWLGYGLCQAGALSGSDQRLYQ